MYVCLEVALRVVPMERGVQLGLGEEPFKWVQCPNPTGTIGPRLARWLILTHMCTF